MILKIAILSILTALSISAYSQACTEALSKAEQDYREGRFVEMKDRLCRCFGAYRTRDGKIKPRKMRLVLEKMQAADSEYTTQLGIFKDYWKDFITTKAYYTDSSRFTYEERYRAFILLSKLYQYLGVLPLAEFLAARAAIMYPDSKLDKEGLSFTQLYKSQRDRVGEVSFGPLTGWSYAIAVDPTNYRQQQSDYKYQSDGRVVLGAHFSYPLTASLAINMNFWFHGSRIVYYTESPTRGGDTGFDFFHMEKQHWIKFPLLIKWSPANHFYWLRKHEQWKTKVFIATGLSVNYLTQSVSTIIDVPNNTSLYNYNTTETRNKFNSDFVLQLLTRFQLGQNYLNIGFTGTYSLKNILNDNLIASPDNDLYNTYNIVENNYKLAGGFWTVTYEYRFNYLKKRHRSK